MKIDNHKTYFVSNYSFVNFTQLDSKMIRNVWKWRNHYDIRKYMYNTEFIPFESHLKFIESLQEREDKIYWLVFKDEKPIGVYNLVDIDYINEDAESGCYLIPQMLDSGIGVEFFCHALELFFGDDISAKTLHGAVMKNNINALVLNGYIGYIFNEDDLRDPSIEFIRASISKESFKSKSVQDILRLKGFAEYARKYKKYYRERLK